MNEELPPGTIGISLPPEGFWEIVLERTGWADDVDVAILMPTFHGPPSRPHGSIKPCGLCGVRCWVAPGNTIEHLICIDCVEEITESLG